MTSTKTYHQKTLGRWGFVHKAIHRERLLRDTRARLAVAEMIAEQARQDAASDRQENVRLRAKVVAAEQHVERVEQWNARSNTCPFCFWPTRDCTCHELDPGGPV